MARLNWRTTTTLLVPGALKMKIENGGTESDSPGRIA
jgi:hypothetical protein